MESFEDLEIPLEETDPTPIAVTLVNITCFSMLRLDSETNEMMESILMTPAISEGVVMVADIIYEATKMHDLIDLQERPSTSILFNVSLNVTVI